MRPRGTRARHECIARRLARIPISLEVRGNLPEAILRRTLSDFTVSAPSVLPRRCRDAPGTRPEAIERRSYSADGPSNVAPAAGALPSPDAPEASPTVARGARKGPCSSTGLGLPSARWPSRRDYVAESTSASHARLRYERTHARWRVDAFVSQADATALRWLLFVRVPSAPALWIHLPLRRSSPGPVRYVSSTSASRVLVGRRFARAPRPPSR